MKFLKVTRDYRVLLTIHAIHNNGSLSQRQISKIISSSLSMTNEYINYLSNEGYIIKSGDSNLKYYLTEAGLKYLNSSSFSLLKEVSSYNIFATMFVKGVLNKVKNDGFKKIVLYGAGEISKIISEYIINYEFPELVISKYVVDKPSENVKKLNGIDVSGIELLDLAHDECVIVAHNTDWNELLQKVNDLKLDINYFYMIIKNKGE